MKRLLAILALGVFAVAPVRAQDAPQQPADKTEEEEKNLAFTDTVVVSGSKVEEKVIDSPATISVITSDSIAVNPAQNFGDLLRSVPGVNVIQMSARDVNLTSRQATNTLSNSQLALLDGPPQDALAQRLEHFREERHHIDAGFWVSGFGFRVTVCPVLLPPLRAGEGGWGGEVSLMLVTHGSSSSSSPK